MTSRSANGREGGRSTREASEASGHTRAKRSKRKERDATRVCWQKRATLWAHGMLTQVSHVRAGIQPDYRNWNSRPTRTWMSAVTPPSSSPSNDSRG